MNLSFVVIEYNCLESIHACVTNIMNACADIAVEVVVSSNSAYSLEKRRYLEKSQPNVKWVFNGTNKGFAGGMNAGILRTTGEIITLMNPDVTIANGDLRRALDYLISNQSVGLMGPRIVDKQNNVQDSCRRFMSPRELLSRLCARAFQNRRVLLDHERDYFTVQSVDWVIGAFMMVRRDALARVGLLDRGYFLYVEDMDWCKRFWDNGFEVVYYPRLEVVYAGDRKSTSALISKTLPNRYCYYHLKSYLRFLRKNSFHVSRRSHSTVS